MIRDRAGYEKGLSLGAIQLLACFLGSSAGYDCNSACDLILGSKSLAIGRLLDDGVRCRP